MINSYFFLNDRLTVNHNNYLFDPFPTFEKQSKPLDLQQYFLRRSYGFEMDEKTAWWFIVKDGHEDLMDYSSNHRNQIRKGLKKCEVRKINLDNDLRDLYNVYNLCCAAYDIEVVKDNVFYNSVLKEEKDKIPFEYFGIYFSGELIGYSKNLIDKNLKMAFYETIYINKEYKKHYPMYALLHRMNNYYLNVNGFEYVSDGSRNLLHVTGVQNFLINKFKFRKAYCKLDVAYKPIIGFFVKLCYPFKGLFLKTSNNLFSPLRSLLLQHNILKQTSTLNE